MTGRIILIALLLWAPIASAVCEAECVFGDRATIAPHEAQAVAHGDQAGRRHRGCAGAPAPSDSHEHTALDCCSIAGGEPAIAVVSLRAFDDSEVLVVSDPTLYPVTGHDHPALGPQAPPGALNSPYLQRNPRLLI